MQGITSIGDALEAQANSKGSGRKLSEGQEVVEGLTLSVALIGESRQSFGPKQVTLQGLIPKITYTFGCRPFMVA